MWFKVECFWIYLLFLKINYSDACSFPSELDGEWYSSHKGLLTINSTMVLGYPIYMSASVQSLDFTCYANSGYKYLLRATETALVFGSDIRGYLCIELYRVSEYKYIYYVGTTVSGTNNDNIYGRIDAVTVTMEDACNRATPYEDGTFVVLVKSGSPISGFGAASCPIPFLAKYSSVAVTDSTGTASCTGTTTLDGCSDRTMSQYTYDGCSGTFSSDGLYICLHSVTSGTNTYLSVWNNDSTVDGTATHRFTCFVISESGSTVSATEYPNYCSDTTQTPTSVPSPGLMYTYTSSTVVVVNSQSSLPFYILIIAGSLTLIAVAILTICIVKKKGCPCKRRVRKPATDREREPEQEEEIGIQEEEEQVEKKSCFSVFSCACCKKCCEKKPVNQEDDRFNATIITLNTLPPLDSLMVGKRRIRVGPIIEANMIKPLPKIQPLYKRELDNGTEKSMRRASIGSTFSFKYKI